MDDKAKLVALRCARVYTSTKNWVKAIGEYELVYAAFPEDPFVVEPLARACYEAGQKMRAMDLYTKAKELYIKKGDEIKAERIQKDMDKYFRTGGQQPAVTGPDTPKGE